ncbi:MULTISPECIES: hypothetical protein [Burkholderia]|uniref:hypothetical protein n=1 Tax=Burkholderia TaxID=32008 RepID=UPI000551D818|nr:MULTISPECIES: hypothetical protein [Burkholderia]
MAAGFSAWSHARRSAGCAVGGIGKSPCTASFLILHDLRDAAACTMPAATHDAARDNIFFFHLNFYL